MAENSRITWTTHTFNPWWGCVRVSRACDACYAEAWDRRTGGKHWGAHAPYREFGDKHWNEPLRWDRFAAAAGERHRVFCGSMCDWADKKGSPAAVARLWALIRKTPNLDWLLLTKRPQLIADRLPADWGSEGWPNVWLGTTAEDNEQAGIRLPHLCAVPAVVRFASCEPLLERLDLRPWLSTGRLGWVIAGGGSGGERAPYLIEWPLDLLEQCRTYGAAYHHKQVGRVRREWPGVTGKGENPAEWPAALRVQEFPTPRRLAVAA